ncbi:MAG: hypothetical protein ACOC3J_07265 [Gemmatimonadota bacterium]
MAGYEGRDRRRQSGEFRVEPRSSPASLLVLAVTAALLVTAAASALLGGGGHSDATPHGQLLGALESVAEAQEAHYQETGRFAPSLAMLELDTDPELHVALARGDGTGWEALARSRTVELSCSQAGGLRNGAPVRDEPICYAGP